LIEIGHYYAEHNPESAVRDTLLHEIAHALVGPGEGHGPKWQATALRIGATPRACDTSPDTVVMPGDWQARCPACEKTFHMYKRPRNLSGYSCRCPAKSELRFEYRGNGTPPATPPPRQTTLRWAAHCPGCRKVYRRARRPKAGIWRCRCAQQSLLAWVFEPLLTPPTS
jgi:predicted SprT family Zn-dependent metalloprotease